MNNEFNNLNMTSNFGNNLNNKNDKWKNALIGIMSVIIIALSVLTVTIVVDKKDNNVDNDNHQQENTDNSTQNENEKDEILEDIILKIEEYDKFVDDFPIKNFNEYVSNISNQDKLTFLWSKVNNMFNGFTKQELLEISSKYFDENFSYIDEDIYCEKFNHIIFKYDSENQKYNYDTNHPGHGGNSCLNKKYYIDNYFENDEYVVNMKILYTNICGGLGESFASKYFDSVKLDNVVYENNDEKPLEHDDVYELVKDKLPITSYKFVKNKSNEFILSSVTIQ